MELRRRKLEGYYINTLSYSYIRLVARDSYLSIKRSIVSFLILGNISLIENLTPKLVVILNIRLPRVAISLIITIETISILSLLVVINTRSYTS